MIPEYNKSAVKRALAETARKKGYDLDALPNLSEESGFAVACQAYSDITKDELEKVDRMVALSYASSSNHMYR